MKKLSISLFAVLAIAFALFSAFTTTKSFAPDVFKILAVDPDEVSASSYTFGSFTGSTINFTMYSSTSELNNLTGATGDWQAELNNTNGSTGVGLSYPTNKVRYSCNTSDTDQLCSASIRDDEDGTDPFDAVLAVIAGDVEYSEF